MVDSPDRMVRRDDDMPERMKLGNKDRPERVPTEGHEGGVPASKEQSEADERRLDTAQGLARERPPVE